LAISQPSWSSVYFFVFLSISLLVRVSVCLPVCLLFCLSVSLSVLCLSVVLSVCLSVCPLVCWSSCLSVCPFFVVLLVYLPVCTFVCWSGCLSVCLFVHSSCCLSCLFSRFSIGLFFCLSVFPFCFLSACFIIVLQSTVGQSFSLLVYVYICVSACNCICLPVFLPIYESSTFAYFFCLCSILSHSSFSSSFDGALSYSVSNFVFKLLYSFCAGCEEDPVHADAECTILARGPRPHFRLEEDFGGKNREEKADESDASATAASDASATAYHAILPLRLLLLQDRERRESTC
jgi:hypothetical protein